MRRYTDGSSFFDGVVVEANVGPIRQGDRSFEAAGVLIAVLMQNHIEARRGPAIDLPANTIRVKVGLKPSQYFNRNRTDRQYGNMLYK